MNHLTNEQLEQILQGIDDHSDHLKDCENCRARLEEKKAIASRLRKAFENVSPKEELVQTIKRQINMQSDPSWQKRTMNLLGFKAHWKGWATAVSAMAALFIMAPVFIGLMYPSSAMAAQKELVNIHKSNLSEDLEFHSEADPEKLAEFFKEKLGFNPRMPNTGHGLALRGCCVRHFQEQVVGSYVVDTPEGVMSIVVVTDSPELIGIDEKFELGGYTYFKSSFAMCDMVSVRIGDYSYCAVGEVSHNYLTELLSRLLPEKDE